MNSKNIEIRDRLKETLKPSRYEHTLGVTYTAVCLAMRYGYDLGKAETAGLLHDCAKCFDNQTILARCDELGIPVTDDERLAPGVLHAKLGAYMAREEYGVDDPEILDAIECHTTGKPNMGTLDKILYMADYIEPGRDKAENLTEMRRLAFIDLDKACLLTMESILDYLEKSGDHIDGTTLEACTDMRRAVMEEDTGRKVYDK